MSLINARRYLVDVKGSELDFAANAGLGETEIRYVSMPTLERQKLVSQPEC